mgnify:CR=1 FL=1
MEAIAICFFNAFANGDHEKIIRDAAMEAFPKIPTSAYGNKIPKGYEKAMRTINYKDVAARCLEVLDAPKRHRNL